MAEIRVPQQMSEEAGPGWSHTTLADPSAVAGLPMRAERWRLDPAASVPVTQAVGETMLYVIAGSGRVRVGEAEHYVEAETVVWLNADDRISFHAGEFGLDVLMGSAAEPSRDA